MDIKNITSPLQCQTLQRVNGIRRNVLKYIVTCIFVLLQTVFFACNVRVQYSVSLKITVIVCIYNIQLAYAETLSPYIPARLFSVCVTYIHIYVWIICEDSRSVAIRRKCLLFTLGEYERKRTRHSHISTQMQKSRDLWKTRTNLECGREKVFFFFCFQLSSRPLGKLPSRGGIINSKGTTRRAVCS